MTTDAEIQEFLSHFGIKGQRWGIRRNLDVYTKIPAGVAGTQIGLLRGGAPVKPFSGVISGLDKFPVNTGMGITSTASALSKAYGFNITRVVPITSPRKANTFAYVSTNGDVHTIHIQRGEHLADEVHANAKNGWLVNSGNHPIEAMLTHEAYHSMFQLSSGKHFFGRIKEVQNLKKKRAPAWDAALKQARADGLILPKRWDDRSPDEQLRARISKYAESSVFSEDAEAEMFAAYHWSPDPPAFVDTWMRQLERDFDQPHVEPFSGRRAR